MRARRKCAILLCTCGALDTWSRRRSTAALGVMTIALFAAFCAVCLASMWQSFRITRYMREMYPSIWSEFGFAGNGWWSAAATEGIDLAAGKKLRRFLKSAERTALQDRRLDRMLLVHRVLIFIGVPMFCVLVLTFALEALPIWASWW